MFPARVFPLSACPASRAPVGVARFGGVGRTAGGSSTCRYRVGAPTGKGPPQAPPEARKFSIAGSPRALERRAPAHAAIQPLSAPRSRAGAWLRRTPTVASCIIGARRAWDPRQRRRLQEGHPPSVVTPPPVRGPWSLSRCQTVSDVCESACDRGTHNGGLARRRRAPSDFGRMWHPESLNGVR